MYTFAEYLYDLGRLDDLSDVNPVAIRLELEDNYEGYRGHCNRNDLDYENLDYEFRKLTGRNPEL